MSQFQMKAASQIATAIAEAIVNRLAFTSIRFSQ